MCQPECDKAILIKQLDLVLQAHSGDYGLWVGLCNQWSIIYLIVDRDLYRQYVNQFKIIFIYFSPFLFVLTL